MDHYDMLVIGSGPSGRRAAVQSATLGKSVLVVDKGWRLGGVSVHTGRSLQLSDARRSLKIAGLDAWNRMGARLNPAAAPVE